MVEPDRPQMTVYTAHALDMLSNKPADTRPEYVTLIALPQQQLLRQSTSMLRYTYIASLHS